MTWGEPFITRFQTGQPLDSKAWNDKPGVKRVSLPVWNKLYWNSQKDKVQTKGTKELEQPFDRSHTGDEGKQTEKKSWDFLETLK